MARIVQSLTQPVREYDQQIQQSFVRDVDSIVTKLNTSLAILQLPIPCDSLDFMSILL